MINFQRRFSSGTDPPPWFFEPREVLLERFSNTSIQEPTVEFVELLEADSTDSTKIRHHEIDRSQCI